MQFKYLRDIIKYHRLYVPRRGQLNDPFDCVVKLSTSDTKKEKEIQSRVDKQIRVLSFSGGDSALTNPLLWSHYADGHKGVCLKFDMNIWHRSAIANAGYVLDSVQYSKKRTLVDLSVISSGQRLAGSAFTYELTADSTEPLERIAFRKHVSWCYEQEWRMICSQKNNKEKIYLGFPPHALVSIIIGLRMSEQNRARIKTLISRYGCSTSVQEAKEDHEAFSLVIESCP